MPDDIRPTMINLLLSNIHKMAMDRSVKSYAYPNTKFGSSSQARVVYESSPIPFHIPIESKDVHKDFGSSSHSVVLDDDLNRQGGPFFSPKSSGVYVPTIVSPSSPEISEPNPSFSTTKKCLSYRKRY